MPESELPHQFRAQMPAAIGFDEQLVQLGVLAAVLLLTWLLFGPWPI